MIAVRQHQMGEVALAPFVEILRVTVLAFGIAPHVETLGHDHHSQRVVHLHLHLRGQVVGGSYGISSHVLQRLDLTDERCLVERRTKRAQIVVQTHALKLARLSVKFKATLLAVSDGSYARIHVESVNHTSVLVKRHSNAIEMRSLGRPETGVGHRKTDVHTSLLIERCVCSLFHPSLRVKERHFHRPTLLPRGAFHLCVERQRGRCRIGLFGTQEGGPRVDAHHRHRHQLHRSVQSCARIPATALWLIAQTDSEGVATRVKKRRDVEAERRIAIGPKARFVTIDIDRGLGHGAIELKRIALARHITYVQGCGIIALAYPWKGS